MRYIKNQLFTHTVFRFIVIKLIVIFLITRYIDKFQLKI